MVLFIRAWASLKSKSLNTSISSMEYLISKALYSSRNPNMWPTKPSQREIWLSVVDSPCLTMSLLASASPCLLMKTDSLSSKDFSRACQLLDKSSSLSKVKDMLKLELGPVQVMRVFLPSSVY